MAPVPPRLRQRTDSVVVRAHLSKTLSNADLLGAFGRTVQGKMAPHSIEQYMGRLRDCLAYVRAPDGRELPLSAWTKETVWEYVHFVEANYCRHLAVMTLAKADGVACRQRVWTKLLPADVAQRDHCGGCKLFQSSQPSIEKRLEALNKFFKFLTRSGVAEQNFVRDLLSEYREDLRKEGMKEKRRNPEVAEVVRLVNETPHPRNRAFYACAAKWWFRPNEMLMLDRHASFPKFDDGGDLVVLPDSKGRFDKRKGNRVSVVDAELRPILLQYLEWWETRVPRNPDGSPKHTKLWITEHGLPLTLKSAVFYPSLFYNDCERLGLMKPGDRRDPLKRWTAHCMRHFGEKLLMMNNCPDTWSKHFRGDAVKDARGQYFVPTPEQVRQKYLEWVPMLGLKARDDGAAGSGPLSGGTFSTPSYGLILALEEGIRRADTWQASTAPFRCSRIVEADERGVEVREYAVAPRRYAAAILYAKQILHPGVRLEVRGDEASPAWGRTFTRAAYVDMLTRARDVIAEAQPAARRRRPTSAA